MEYTAFKAGDKVSWDGIKAVVFRDSSAENRQVEVSCVGGCGSEVWDKMYPVLGSLIPVVLDESV